MKKLNIISAILFSAMMFGGCEKEESPRLNQNNENTISDYKGKSKQDLNNKSFYVVGSANNPHNQLGFDHNQILDYMRSSFSPSMSKATLYSEAVNYAENTLGYSNLESNLSQANVDELIINYSAPTDFYSEINDLLENGLLTSSEHAYLEDMLDIGSAPTCISCSLDEAVNLALNEVESLENQVLGDSQLSSTESDNILMTIAVFKYSMDFWRNEAQRSSTNYSINLLQGGGTGNDFVPGLPWYARDTAGAATTLTTAGGYLFALAGPAGVVGGTLIGGAVSSMV